MATNILASIKALSKLNKKTEVYSIYEGTRQSGARATVEIQKRARNIPLYISKAARRGILEVGLEAFEMAMQMVPVDTGETARSGRLTINNVIYAKGESDGQSTGVSIVNRADGSLVPTKEDMDSVIRGSLNLGITFRRQDENGNNLALRLHEELLPRGTGPSEARKGNPPRGGKFIEVPLQRIRRKITAAIRREMQETIKLLK